MKINRFHLLACAAFALLLVSPDAARADDWKKYKGDCDRVLNAHKTVIIGRLKECVGLWIAYVDPNTVKPARRQALKDSFQSLYDRGINRGDEEAEYLAISGAERIKMRLQLRLKTSKRITAGNGKVKTERGVQTASRRQKFRAPEVSADNRKKARKLVKKGIGHFKRKKRAKALKAYLEALEYDPANLDGLYNAAAEYAHRGDGEQSVELLQKLQDLGTKPALRRIKSARRDTDFEPIHNYIPYKKVTGFARIKVVNSLGDYGEDEVDRIAKTLEKLSYPVEDQGVDKVKNRKAPVIFFKDHSTPTAYLCKKVLIHPGTQLSRITWKTDYDIIITWGNKLVKKDGVKQPAKDYTDVSPDKAEKRLDDLAREEDKILREPEKVARKVDHTIDTPKRVERKVDNSVKRVDRTVKTIEKTGDKIKGIFK